MEIDRKHAIKTAAVALAAAGCFAFAAGSLPREQLLDWGRKAAMLSAGFQQPEGGAEALSNRIEHHLAGGAALPDSSSFPDAGWSGSEQQPPLDVPSSAPVVIPPRGEKGGIVSEEQLSLGSNFVQGVATRNKSGKTFDLAKEVAILPTFRIPDNGEPQVLIVHTHTTESFMPYYAGYYNDGDTPRTTDESKNIVTVGRAIAEQLRAAGIRVTHDTTVHDSPKYTGAYDRSAETVKKNLEKYPSIKVVLDIHRDGIMRDETTKVKPTTVINGRKAAQVMIITGVVDTKAIPHPNWQENFHFGLMLQSALHTQYEGLVRPLSIVASRYNQHLAPGYLLLEMGSEGNTMEEAVYSGQLVGKTLAQVLYRLKEE